VDAYSATILLTRKDQLQERVGVFRGRVIGLWWRTLRRRSQRRSISWTRTLALAERWLPQPRALRPFPDARFAATHLR